MGIPHLNIIYLKDVIISIFLFLEDSVIYQLGGISHEVDGSDQEKLKFLQDRVKSDIKRARLFNIPDNYMLTQGTNTYNALTFDRYEMLCQKGESVLLFEGIFDHYNVGKAPLICVTYVVDGEIKIDGQDEIKSSGISKTRYIMDAIPEHFLEAYYKDDTFRLDKLLDDDFFKAIRLTFKEGYYVSSLKLMMSYIDTVACLEFGDVQRNFQQWLDTYVDMESLEASSDEVWEYRNSLLHMTNPFSRKVVQGTIRKVYFYIAPKSSEKYSASDTCYLNYPEFISAVARGTEIWGDSYQGNEKIEDFVRRYERIVSDSRYVEFNEL